MMESVKRVYKIHNTVIAIDLDYQQQKPSKEQSEFDWA